MCRIASLADRSGGAGGEWVAFEYRGGFSALAGRDEPGWARGW